jgi:hypothetical protein
MIMAVAIICIAAVVVMMINPGTGRSEGGGYSGSAD